MTATAQKSSALDQSSERFKSLTMSARNGCKRSQDALILHCQQLVNGILKGYRICGEIYNDCKSEAAIATIKAVRTFNPHRGFSLSSYASWYIHAAIRKTLRENKLISIPKGKWYQAKAAQESADCLSTTNTTLFAAQFPQTSLFSEIQFEPEQISANSRSVGPADFAERNYLEEAIYKGLDQLPAFEKRVISGRYGISQEKPVSSREMARRLNCNRSAIVKAEETAKRSLQIYYEAKGLRSFIGEE
ncbi:sigma-70 family RNA polymerase sigma factor [Turneriella parva]|uniref:RNA polymerase, sigma 27/28 subunit, RpsK/SigK n=1 Tax=Turneriella parva (strain ATCC BAA-1111 / DSM 21527 / NCTC 11395 / H) TaxID=869212 RepID=I4BAB3_TURPD|nr:sigma-70 family RNA polymerase sigma factor [Turneriella parva]AFM14220.1 RNA polymerase, sigma 27/28 subunit, RpsK/SigK [Turneriella parva DSM 21527]